METLAQIGEDALIARLTKDLPVGKDVLTAAGDDCAVVQPVGSGLLQLLKTDCIVEGVHFLRETPKEKVGWKALARVISDIGSMGGTPQHAMITLILPPDLPVYEVEELYKGLRRCADAFGVSIVGGETSRGSQWIISVSLTGTAPVSRCLLRSGAKVGDAIYVTGRLGGSLAGHHLDFIPRVAEAQWLAEHFQVQAMMDLSDGLAKDLPRMAAASGVSFILHEASLPLNPGCTPAQAWSDGEDYELLLALPSTLTEEQYKLWQSVFPQVPLSFIGNFVELGAGKMPSLSGSGWDHFNALQP